MTIQKLYFSNLSPVWPIKKQEAILAGIDGIKFCDELPSSERRGFRLEGLPQRGTMLRPSRRDAVQIIFVASVAVLARNAEDLMVLLSHAAERNATIRDVSAEMDIKPNAKSKDLKAVAALFAEARKRSVEVERGKAGGMKSGGVRAKAAKELAEQFESDWVQYGKTNQDIAKESGLSVNTLKLYLGRRKEARANYYAALKRKEGAYAKRGRATV